VGKIAQKCGQLVAKIRPIWSFCLAKNSPNLVILFGEKFAQSGHSVWDPSVIKKMPN
jgi:hypothetical protein